MMNPNIYASYDDKFCDLRKQDLGIPTEDYMCFQMVPLQSIFLLCVN